jgi:glycine/D-amino acid oxidase-like deaminating enzyme
MVGISPKESTLRIWSTGSPAFSPSPRATSAEARARLQHELVALFPDLHDVAITHVWTGNIAMTRSDLPAIGQRDGIWYALGCNGSGVALMTYLGHKLALKVLGDKQGDTAFDDIAFKPLPFYDGRPWFLRLMTYWFRARDFWRDHIAS